MAHPFLQDLIDAATAAHPEWPRSLAPGLAAARIDELLAPLGGWRPPDDVLALYAEHDGQVGDDEHCLWAPCGLLPLEQAVQMHLEFRQHFPQWPPLLTIGYGSKTNLEVPLSKRRSASQPLYVRDYEGMPFRAFTGMKGLLQAAAECYRQGVFRWNDEYAFWEDRREGDEKDDRRHRIRLRFNRGASPTLWDDQNEVLGKHWINPHDALSWPGAWHAYIGFNKKAFEPVGATATVTDVVTGQADWSRPVIIHGAIEGLTGGRDMRVTLSDGTQFLEVICKGALATGIVLGDRFEFELQRPLDAEELAELRRQDEETDRAMRKHMRELMDRIEAKATGTAPEADALGLSDFMNWDPGASARPAYFAKRVALVERIDRDDDEPSEAPEDFDLEAFEKEIAEAHDTGFFAGKKRFEPAYDVGELAASVLNNYRTNYRPVQKFEPVDVRELEDFPQRLYARAQKELGKLGFEYLGDWEIANARRIFPNMPRIAMRAFTHLDGTVCAFYTFPDAGWRAMIPPRKPPADGILDVVSAYADGHYWLTTSAGDGLKFETAPACDRECLPIGSKFADVVRRHRERVAAAAPASKPVIVKTLEEYLKHVRQRHKIERAFHLGRVPTPAELVRMGTNPELSERVHAAMVEIAATIDPGGRD